MAVIRPFAALRPVPEKATCVAALPYDVFNEEEARKEVERVPLSFLAIDRPETQFPKECETNEIQISREAGKLFRKRKKQGIFQKEICPCFYVYALTRNGRTQTGLAACVLTQEYENGMIRQHEDTRRAKEEERVRHIEACGAQTGPVFLAYRQKKEICRELEKAKRQEPLYDFQAADGVRHQVWKIEEAAAADRLIEMFSEVPALYIADGHHRAAAAVRVCRLRTGEHPNLAQDAPCRSFLAVLFPDNELEILGYHRVVRISEDMASDELLKKLDTVFEVRKKTTAFYPKTKGQIGMYLKNQWYCLNVRFEKQKADPADGLDAALLQSEVLKPFFGIDDPRTSKQLSFVGGTLSPEAFERQYGTENTVLFTLPSVTVGELFAAADAGKRMPPKSTWFEPKLRSGLLIHEI